MVTLDARLGEVIGGKTAKALERAFDMQTVRDLLAQYPRRLAERGELTELLALRIDDEVTVVADVLSSAVKGPPRSPRLEVVVGDGTATLQLVFFGARSVNWRKRELTPGVRGLFAGKIGEFNRKRQLVHPEYMLLRGDPMDEVAADVYAGRLIPVYPATQSVRTWVISNSVQRALEVLDPIPDPLDAELRARRSLLSSDAALRAMHQPDDRQQWQAARRRLAWDEALGVQLALAQRRLIAGANPAVPRPRKDGGLLEAFDATLEERRAPTQVA